jgi:hypothetical protein
MYEVITLEEDQKIDPRENYGVRNTDNQLIEMRTPALPYAESACHSMNTLMENKPWLQAGGRVLQPDMFSGQH